MCRNLTPEQKKEWILENCIDSSGDIDLNRLDFSDFNGDVFIGKMKVKNDLYQGAQEVGGDLYQGSQEVGKDLFQSNQKVGQDLFQSNQKVGQDLYQDYQEVNDTIHQSHQNVGRNLYQSHQNVDGELYQNGQSAQAIYNHKPSEIDTIVHCNGRIKITAPKQYTYKELVELVGHNFTIKEE